jgi:vancomycin resistance protein YoaR
MRFPRLPGVPLVGMVSLATVVVAAAGVFAVRDRLYAGEPLPGIGVAEPQLGGTVDIVVAGTRVRVAPDALLRVDASATSRAALAAGRESTLRRAEALLLPLPPGRLVQPVLRLRKDAWERLLAELDRFGRAPRAATVAMHGMSPVVRPGRDGTRVDPAALFAALVRHSRVGQSPIHAHWIPLPPALNDAVAGRAAATARRLVSGPIELRFRGRRVGSLAPAKLARLVRFRPAPHAYVVEVAEKPLAALLRPLVRPWTRAPVDATFRVDGKRAHVVPAKYGLGLDAAAGAAAVAAVGRPARRHIATLRLARVRATLTTRAARRLGIRRKLASYTTDLSTASASRLHDVRLLADEVAGTIIRRGRVFSFAHAAGPPTAARGFLGGQETVGAVVIPSVAYAVAQTATTLLNGAFRLGLPILERHNYPEYVAAFPPGRDATVSWDGSDLRFRNDLKHALLIEATYSDRALTLSFYGTPQLRSVSTTTGLPTDWVAPPRVFGPPGTGQDGFDVRVGRTVSARGKVVRRDALVSHYEPVGATAIRRTAVPSGTYLVLPPR